MQFYSRARGRGPPLWPVASAEKSISESLPNQPFIFDKTAKIMFQQFNIQLGKF
jgi:hypothetical protein